MKKWHCILILLLWAGLAACTHPTTMDYVTGTDRDEHGCRWSAGYVWSNVRHDCVRLWEVGTRLDAGAHSAYLVFSTDSTFAEVFVPEGGSVVCRRRKKTQEWRARSGVAVTVRDGVTVVRTKERTYSIGFEN